MICPYNRRMETQVVQTTYTYDENGNNDSVQQITRTRFEMIECPRDACGAYQEGRCRYASVNMENE